MMSERAATLRPSLSMRLAQEIVALIRERNLQPGDRLPPAKALAEHFSVATPTIREALRQLQATGVVDMRHGSGIYVRQREERLMLTNPAYGALETHTVVQILDARLLIEPSLAELAAQRATAADLEELAAIVADADRALTRFDDTYFRANVRFHTTVARSSGNFVLAQIVESLTALYSSELHLVDPARTLEELREADHQGHHAVLKALIERDGEAAAAAMRQHIAAARSHVAARLAADSPDTLKPGDHARATRMTSERRRLQCK